MNTKRIYKFVYLTTLISISTYIPISAAADITTERPTVTKALDIFEEYPEKVPPGTNVTFKRKENQLASKLIEAGVQARVFAMSAQESTPNPITTIDNCNVYISVVIPLRATNKTDVFFQKVEESWLTPSHSGNSIKDGRYYIVFEKAGPTQEHFRLKSTDAAAYFDTGFRLVVSDNGSADLEKVKSEYEKRKEKLDTLRLEIDESKMKAPCYRYTKFAEVPELIEYNENTLALCEYENKIN